jgi:acyl-CoA synthetase (AMP-forming)/AMP-acid ligase II
LTYLFAASELGLIAAPLNTRWSPREVAAALRDCEPRVIVCDADLWPLLQASLFDDEKGGTWQEEVRAIVILYAEEQAQTSSIPTAAAAAARSPGIPILTHEALLLQQAQAMPSTHTYAHNPSKGDDIHCLVYTSGSTGEPKGVMLSHTAQFIQALEKVNLGHYTRNTTYLSLAPLFHVAGLNSSIAVTLAGGTHVFLHKPEGARGLGGADLALQAIQQHQVDTLVVVPTMLAALVAECEAVEKRRRRNNEAVGLRTRDNSQSIHPQSSPSLLLPSIDFVLVGGQALTEQLWHKARKHMPQARFVQSYACSEACSSISFLELPSAGGKNVSLSSFPPLGAIGQAAHPVEVAIMALPDEGEEREKGEEDCASARNRSRIGTSNIHRHTSAASSPSPVRRFEREPGKVGEIATRGPHVMKGYWRRPEASAAVLLFPAEEKQETSASSSSSLNSPWLCTGDLGFLDAQGHLHLMGRLADVIRSGGEKIMASEVEQVLRLHPQVAEVAVVGLPDSKFGERPVAIVLLKMKKKKEGITKEEGKEKLVLLAEELKQWCRRHLAGYKVPREIHFMAALPLTGSGKIMKTQLRRSFL